MRIELNMVMKNGTLIASIWLQKRLPFGHPFGTKFHTLRVPVFDRFSGTPKVSQTIPKGYRNLVILGVVFETLEGKAEH